MQKNLTLKNGLRFLFIEDKNAEATALGLSTGAGVYFEKEDKSGISHLLEHLIGRSRVDGGSFREVMYKKGGVLEASTSLFKTYFYLTCLPEDLTSLSEIFIRGIFSPDFSEAQLKKSKQSVVSELAYMEDIEAYKILRNMMWKDPKLARPIVGSKSSVLEISLSELQKYHKNHYNAGHASVVVLSAKFPEELVNLLETIPLNGDSGYNKINSEINIPTHKLLQERNLKSAIAISFPTKGFEGLGEGRHYFNLTAAALTEFYVSHLASLGLIYEESWVWNVYPKNGDFILFLDDIEHSHLLPTLKAVVKIIDDWTQSPMNEREFEMLVKHKILDLKTHTSISEKIILLTKSFSSSEEVHTYEEAIAVYEKAQIEDVMTSFGKILLSQKPFIVVSTGLDSEMEVGEIEEFLEDYYKI